jgi:hypothetical protein
MTPQEKSQIRLRLIDLVAEYVTATCGEFGPDQENPLLTLLAIYKEDTLRRARGLRGSLDFLWDRLKVGVRLAGTLMQELQESDGDLLHGWSYGAPPLNMMQRLYTLLYETSLELKWSIQEIESQHPDMRMMFDLERDAYRRTHLQWQAEDEAERQRNA